MERILVIGANGQIGSELVGALAQQHGADNVIASDIGTNNLYQARRYAQLNVLDKDGLAKLIADEGSPRCTSWRPCCRPRAKRRH